VKGERKQVRAAENQAVASLLLFVFSIAMVVVV
jgi:hypothetical protein